MRRAPLIMVVAYSDVARVPVGVWTRSRCGTGSTAIEGFDGCGVHSGAITAKPATHASQRLPRRARPQLMPTSRPMPLKPLALEGDRAHDHSDGDRMGTRRDDTDRRSPRR